MTFRALLCVGAATLACAQPGGDGSGSGRQGDEGLVGTWDASMSLIEPYQLEMRDPPRRHICGTMGFIGRTDAPGMPSAGFVGVYDLDLRGVGLHWLGDPPAPIAVGTAMDARYGSIAGALDSVSITINSGSDEVIVLRGAQMPNEIEGSWSAQSVRGTASGLFRLHRRDRMEKPAVC